MSGSLRPDKFYDDMTPLPARLSHLARFWWTFAVPVSRRDYLRHGVALIALKYAGDVALVAVAAGRLWTPADYLGSIPFLLATRLDGAPPWLMPALALWTLPFLWAGVTLSMRRALDAGWSAWVALLFFVPYLNYPLMLALSVSVLQRYGVGLFFGTPFGIGVLTGFLFNRRYPASGRETTEVAAMTLAVVAGAAFLLGNEGMICLAGASADLHRPL